MLQAKTNHNLQPPSPHPQAERRFLHAETERDLKVISNNVNLTSPANFEIYPAPNQFSPAYRHPARDRINALAYRTSEFLTRRLLHKCSEMLALFALSMNSFRDPAKFEFIFSSLDEYDDILLTYSDVRLANARVFEIGYGQRPERLFTLLSRNIEARGVDLEAPMLTGSPREVIRICRASGCWRMLRTLTRFVLFDLQRRRELARELRNCGMHLTIPSERFMVQDAAKLTLTPHSLDLIYSEDVFEHIRPSSLEQLTAKMAQWLTPDGLALIRPNIFTGITGGHLTEWFDTQHRTRKSEPWEHLRKKRYLGDVYLNQLTRRHYRELFSKHFTIIEERVKYPDRGREYLNCQIARELSSYGDEELFSNQVMFILRPKRPA